MKQVNEISQVLKEFPPASSLRGALSVGIFKKLVESFVKTVEQGDHGEFRLHTAYLAAVTFSRPVVEMDVLNCCGMSVLADDNILIRDNAGSQVVAEQEVQGIRTGRISPHLEKSSRGGIMHKPAGNAQTAGEFLDGQSRAVEYFSEGHMGSVDGNKSGDGDGDAVPWPAPVRRYRRG